MNCEQCREQCACRAAKAEGRYRAALVEIGDLAMKLLANEDGGHEPDLQEFLVSVSQKTQAALDDLEGADGMDGEDVGKKSA